MDYPCKGCEERHIGCHSTCERYLKAQEINNSLHGEIMQKKLRERDANNYTSEMISKIKKRIRRRR